MAQNSGGSDSSGGQQWPVAEETGEEEDKATFLRRVEKTKSREKHSQCCYFKDRSGGEQHKLHIKKSPNALKDKC
jgi:hypothetical protein